VGDVEHARDQRDQDTHGEGASERDRAAGLLAVRPDAEEDQQGRQHDRGVTDDQAMIEPDPVHERDGAKPHANAEKTAAISPP
jgi:hypothetical protein